MIRDHWGDREAALCRELTKIHEELVIRPISGLIEAVGKPRGEYTCVVWPPPVATHSAPELPTGIVLAHELAQTIGKVGSRRDGVKEMARKYKLSQRKMYAAIETSKEIVQKT
jgi:16S rRNA (cytidine1402-2'-O)-methyltransferase